MVFLRKYQYTLSQYIIPVGSILLIAVITHAIRIGQLGFYYDDWDVLWSGAARGARSLVGLYYADRRAMGHLYEITYRVLGDSLAGWHLYAWAWRCIGALAFFWIFRILWPERRLLSTLAAMIFVVYPGFLSEPDALTKVNHLTTYGLALASIALQLASIQARDKRVGLLFGALAFAAGSAYVWIYEYMIGLEVMRLALLGLLFYKRGVKGFASILKAIALRYWPYVITLSGFLYWRLFIFTSTRPATNVSGLLGSYQSNPLYMGLRVVVQTLLDFLSVTLFAWFVQFYHLLAEADYASIAVAMIVALAGLLVALLYWRLFTRTNEPDHEASDDSHTAMEMAVVGAVSALGAILPVVASNRSIDLMDAYKSYGLHPSAGAILLVMGGVVLLRPRMRMAVLLGLLFISVATNSLNIDHWKTFWQNERNMWWQVTWRAPNIADGTLVMAYAPDGYRYEQDYEVWSPINLIYRPGRAQSPLIQSEVLNTDTLRYVKAGVKWDGYRRDIPMQLNYGNLLLISQPTLDSCVHVIDGKMPAFPASEALIVEEAGIYSDVGRIQTKGNPPTPPTAIFGPEPAHGWCYYYQKASLARQMGDWQKVLDLYNAAQEEGLKPVDRSEYFPFIEAMVNSGKIDAARSLYERTIQNDEALSASLCSSLAKDPGYPASFGYNFTALHELFCGN